jgi:AraC family transcriptional regulator, transcriptional activator of the genes for pyochelin and ferripyochelin receptors
MDKINLSNWNSIFSRTNQQVLFASDRYTDIHFQFEEPGLVSGSMHSVSTPGMQLTEFCLNSNKPVQLMDDASKETAESVFVLDGISESHFQNLSSTLAFNKHHHNFQYNDQFGGMHVIHSPRFQAMTITYDLNFLKELLQPDTNSSIGQLASCVHNKKTFLPVSKSMGFQNRTIQVIGSIQQCPFYGVTRYLFLESKMMELFVLQMEQIQVAAGGKKDENWSRIDSEKLQAVKNYIENAYLDEFNLTDLTYKFGLNEFKLKKGYKQLFQITVFGHVHQLRMERAKKVLEDKSMNVSEAAFFIGYNNVSSFCTEFKKRFGYSPGKICVYQGLV